LGATAITALTAQNTKEVRTLHPVAPGLVDAQMGAVLDDLPVAAVKTGMLATVPVLDVVARKAANGELPNLVVDPVLVSSSGARLFDRDAERAYCDVLFPHALVITPNLREASILVGRDLRTEDAMTGAARELAETGARVVVVKGGHLAGDPVDIVLADGVVRELRTVRIATKNTHGTGCTFASAVAAGLARGSDPLVAIERAKRYVSAALRGAVDWRLGAGHGPLDQLGVAQVESEPAHAGEGS
jgi:hydroxymethylpyrimidine/phosphomethylpyrimidine kinase